MIWIVHGFWLVNKLVCVHSTTKHENYILSNEWWEFTVSASNIIFLFVKTENNNFIKEIKYLFCTFIAWWKPRQSFWEFSSRWNPRLHLGFSLICSWILPNICLGFHQAIYERRYLKSILFLNYIHSSWLFDMLWVGQGMLWLNFNYGSNFFKAVNFFQTSLFFCNSLYYFFKLVFFFSNQVIFSNQ